MSLPTVAIVGRPNVGKSSVFNWLVGRRLAIVDSLAGVTRDRMIRVVEHRGSYFELVDTGGVGINDVDDLDREIDQQIEAAIRAAQLVLFVVDIRQGLTPLDSIVAQRLHGIGKPVILAANKADEEQFRWQAADFFSLGFDEPLCISAQNFRGKEELLDAIVVRLPKADADEASLATQPPTLKIAIVGKRNVGKSTFVNALTEDDRMIVSEVAGTTRDSVDVTIQVDGKPILMIDTPGFRRRKSVRTDIEFYSTHRAQRSIRYADVTLMFFAAEEEISKVDRQLVSYIEKNHKPVIFVVNKWDLVADKIVTQQWADYLHENFPGLKYVPIVFITGRDGKNVRRLLNHAQMLFKQAQWRVSTGVLNRLLRQAMLLHPPPVIGPRRPRIYFASQVATQPPMIVIKCSDPDAFPQTYRRFLLGVLRDQLKFGEVPIRMFFEQRDSHSTVRPASPAAGRSMPDPSLPLDRDLTEQDLSQWSPEDLGRWISAQEHLAGRRGSQPTAGSPAETGAASGAAAGVEEDDALANADFDPHGWDSIYQDSLVELPDEVEDDD